MPDNEQTSKKAPRGTFVERLMRRALTSFGAVFERPFTKTDETEKTPLTSDLTERLKQLIDSAVREQTDGSRIAPHLIRLKYSWGQTTDEFETALERLKNELLIVAVDHINDNRYRTIAPIKLETKPDILTEGFSLAVGFDETTVSQAEKLEVPAEIFAGLLPAETQQTPEKPTLVEVKCSFVLANDVERNVRLHFIPNGKTNLTVGRSKENDLFLDDKSVSKLHTSLVMDSEGTLLVADVGSTNGTFVENERIGYGKAVEIIPNQSIRFGDIDVKFDWEFQPEPEEAEEGEKAEIENGEDIEEEPETVQQKEPETVFASEPETVKGVAGKSDSGADSTAAQNDEKVVSETVENSSQKPDGNSSSYVSTNSENESLK